MGDPWPRTLGQIAGVLLFAVLLGVAAGFPLPALAAAALGCLGWLLYRLYRLERWLRADARQPPLAAEGLWGELYHHYYRLRKRSRKRKRRLTRALNQFQKAAAALPDACVVLDWEGAIRWCNDPATRLLGLRYPQDLGRPVVDLVRHPAFADCIARRRGGECAEFPSPVNDALRVAVRVVNYGKGQRLLLAEDVSRLRRLEQTRRDFVANVSHELRTPLTVISGYLEGLLDSGDCAAPWRPPLLQMQQQASRMQSIIDDLLLLSRLETQIERPPPRPVAVPDLLADLVEDARLLSGERRHDLRLEAEPGLWLLGSEQELRSAFSNLLANAVRYTPAGGRIVVRWFADGGGVHLAVEDTGEGIAEHHLPRLTERFYRVDRGRQRDSGGTGLGLAIVKHVLSRHGGQLRVASQLGCGSTFTCDFPPALRVERAA